MTYCSIRRRKFTMFVPLALCVIPTIIIGYGFVIPQSCIKGINPLSVGFGISILSFIATYWSGIKLASGGPKL